MPRQARLDAPGTLHHVIIRGMERGQIVKDPRDREAFVRRLGEVATATRTTVYAWVILPNHAHLLVRSGPTGLPRFMRRLLTGYAITFNRRHKRYGHLFQNRYKSIVCEEDTYFRELVRYIHLNPVRAGLVADLADLDRYHWCGHAAIIGRMSFPWQDSRYVLAWFGNETKVAIRAYRRYLAEGNPMARRPDLVGGGLVRSLGGWSEVRAARRQKEQVLGDARILGNGEFVEEVLQQADQRTREILHRNQRIREAAKFIHAACERNGIAAEELRSGSRRGPIPALRGRLARRLVTKLGLSLAEAARHLGVSTSAISKAVSRVAK